MKKTPASPRPCSSQQEFIVNDTETIFMEMMNEAYWDENSCPTCEGRMAPKALFIGDVDHEIR